MTGRRIARILRGLAACVLGFAALGASADAGSLHEKYSQLREALSHNPYQRPLYIDSAEAGDALKGDVYAVVDHPFAQFESALKDPADWCAIMTLPFNAKYCRPAQGANGQALLSMRIGRKPDQPVDEAYRIDFAMSPGPSGADFFQTRLNAGQGPVGTHDYRIMLEAVPLEGDRTFMHLSYSYASGGMARFAMQTYLSTAGADKVGFSIAGKDAQGHPQYIGGVRGVIERNVMRYYLAIEAHLASLAAPREERLDKRLRTWFDAAERYSRQLHEMDRAQYIALKKADAERQQAGLDEGSPRVSSRGRTGE